MHTMYYDLWTEWSDMDLRSNKMLKAYNIDAYKTYPALRAMHTMYYDLWTEWSDMDLRSNKMLKAYNIDAYKTYPAMRIIPELTARNVQIYRLIK